MPMPILLPLLNVVLALLLGVLKLDVLMELASLVHLVVPSTLLVKRVSRSGHLAILATLN